jgi:uracil-DNA glycosylase
MVNNSQKKDKKELLSELITATKNNHSLPLYTPENLFVPGVGPLDADIMIIGEAPGKEEVLQGQPFIGRSGKLLSKLLQEEGFDRTQLFVTNVVKYRPPQNRTPTRTERDIWANEYLKKEIAIIAPKIIITLGATATKIFLGENISMTKKQGQIIDLNGIKIISTYHPAYLLRNPAAIAEVKKTLKEIKAILPEIVHNYVHNLFITCL